MPRSRILVATLCATLAVVPAAHAEYVASFTIGTTADPNEYRIFPEGVNSTPADGCALFEMSHWVAGEGPQGSAANGWGFFKAVPLRITSGAGLKTVHIQGRDTCGRLTNIATQTVWHGPRPKPTPGADPIKLSSILLPATTTSNDVTTNPVTSGGDGCAQARFANEDGNWQNWGLCKASPHSLTPGFGYRGVYAQVKGYDGTVSNVLYSRITVLRAQAPAANAPVPVVRKVSLPTSTTNASVTVRITATDDHKVTMMRFANEDGVWLRWRAFSASSTHALSSGVGYKGVYVQVKDARHRTSNIVYTRTRVYGGRA